MSNVFSFTGTIGRDAEVRSTPNGQSVLNVTVPTTRALVTDKKHCGYEWLCGVSARKVLFLVT